MDIDPTNGTRMVYLALGLPDHVPFFSSDRALSWSKTPSFTTMTLSALLDPWITYDSKGNVYAGTYIGNDTHPFDWLYPFLARSIDHSANFTLLSTSFAPPEALWTFSDGSTSLSCSSQFGPGLAIDFPKIVADKTPSSPFRDNAYIIGAVPIRDPRVPNSGCVGVPSLIRTTDGGQTWDLRRVIDEASDRPDNLAIAPNGTIYFGGSFAQSTDRSQWGLSLAFSKDAGLTWHSRIVPLGYGADNPWVAVSKNNSNLLYIAFENSYHIYLIKSGNGGATWSVASRLDDVLPNDSVDHALPSIDVGYGERIFVAWRDYRNTPSKMRWNSNTTDIYAYSSNSPYSNIRISTTTGRFCGAYSPCYRVTGNDYFEVVSGNASDYVAYSLDQDQNSWPEAYAVVVSYSPSDWSSIQTLFYKLAAGIVASILVVLSIAMRRRHQRGPQNRATSESPASSQVP